MESTDFPYVLTFVCGMLGSLSGTVFLLVRAAKRHGRLRMSELVRSWDGALGLFIVALLSGLTGTLLSEALDLDYPPQFVAFVVGMFAHDKVFDVLRTAVASRAREAAVPKAARGESTDEAKSHVDAPKMGRRDHGRLSNLKELVG